MSPARDRDASAGEDAIDAQGGGVRQTDLHQDREIAGRMLRELPAFTVCLFASHPIILRWNRFGKLGSEDSTGRC